MHGPAIKLLNSLLKQSLVGTVKLQKFEQGGFTEFYQISLKNLPYVTNFGQQLMAYMVGQ